jgi:aspartate/methionine/tyrosine aminotransferase
MSGWRVGFVSGSPINIKHILHIKSNFDSGMYKPIQLAATKALSLGEEWFDDLNSEYRERAKIVYELLDFLQCTYTGNQSGMFVWAKVNSNQLSGENLSNQLLYSTNIFVTPGFVFGSNGDQYIRISLCASQTQLKEALNRLKTTNL